MFSLFKKNIPPPTNLENYVWVPHLRDVINWFIANDAQVALVSSRTIHTLYSEGYRPDSNIDNDPYTIEKGSNGEMVLDVPEKWILIRTWMELNNSRKKSKTFEELESNIEYIIDRLDEYGGHTLVAASELVHLYDLDPNVLDLDIELSKIQNSEEKENFKHNYFCDVMTGTEIRLLAWIYKELFKKNYIRKEIREKSSPSFGNENDTAFNKIQKNNIDASEDEVYHSAKALSISKGYTSTALLQTNLSIGYTRAACIIDLLEHYGIVEEATSDGRPRRLTSPYATTPYPSSFEEDIYEEEVLNPVDLQIIDDIYPLVKKFVLSSKTISALDLQRRFKLHYSSIAALIERLESEGIVSPPNNLGSRKVI